MKWASRCGEWRRSWLPQKCSATPRLLVNYYNYGAFFYSLTWYFTIFSEEMRIVVLGGYFHVLFRQLVVQLYSIPIFSLERYVTICYVVSVPTLQQLHNCTYCCAAKNPQAENCAQIPDLAHSALNTSTPLPCSMPIAPQESTQHTTQRKKRKEGETNDKLRHSNCAAHNGIAWSVVTPTETIDRRVTGMYGSSAGGKKIFHPTRARTS